MNIVLVGYMASGKSAVGKLLSSQLKLKHIDLDDFIEKKEQLSISEIFKKKGEVYFRKKETEYLKELLKKSDNYCISTGGGTPCYGNNMEIIQKFATSIYLKTSIHEIYKRLKFAKNKRPLIAHLSNDSLLEFIGKHLFERAPFYQKATATVLTDKKSTNEVVALIRNYTKSNIQKQKRGRF